MDSESRIPTRSEIRDTRDHSQPELIGRRVREDWATGGSADIYARARARALQILHEHRPPPLPSDVMTQIGQIIHDAAAELASPTN